MSMREAIVNKALSIVGKSRDDIGCSGTHAWCAHAVSQVLKSVGIDMWDLSCNSMKKKMSDSPNWDEPDSNPIPGDILFFDWDHKVEALPLDHVGIVVAFDTASGTITYVNGNGSSSTHVTKQTINIKHNSISYWMRYVESTSSVSTPTVGPVKPAVTVTSGTCTVSLSEISKGAKSYSVEILQRLLNIHGYKNEVTGEFNTTTDSVLRKFQTDKKLAVDGICGSNTWKALISAL